MSMYDALNKEWMGLNSLRDEMIQSGEPENAQVIQNLLEKLEEVMEIYFVSEFVDSIVAID